VTESFTFGTLSNATEAERLSTILAQCFVSQPALSSRYVDRVGTENFVVARQGSEIAGGLATLEMGQWFGGRCVPMTGIAAVAVAPEYRGRDVAIELVRYTLEQLFDRGVALSTLYPAAQKLYRLAGYEQGGCRCVWEIATEHIHISKPLLPVRRAPAQTESVRDLYQQYARRDNGTLDRHPHVWQNIWNNLFVPDDGDSLYTYLFGYSSGFEGYITLSQKRLDRGTILHVRDYAVLTQAAGRSFWGFLNAHRSQVDTVRWHGSSIDPLTLLLPEQGAYLTDCLNWMTRIVCVETALAQRGYPLLSAELHLQVDDDLLPANRDRFILSIANRQATVTRGGRGDLKLTVAGLVPLYTGLMSPQVLQRLGYLEASEETLALARQIFATSTPWMPDFF